MGQRNKNGNQNIFGANKIETKIIKIFTEKNNFSTFYNHFGKQIILNIILYLTCYHILNNTKI